MALAMTVKNPQLINDLAAKFGSQCIVVAIDAKKINNQWIVHLVGGKVATEKELFSWAKASSSMVDQFHKLVTEDQLNKVVSSDLLHYYFSDNAKSKFLYKINEQLLRFLSINYFQRKY